MVAPQIDLYTLDVSIFRCKHSVQASIALLFSAGIDCPAILVGRYEEKRLILGMMPLETDRYPKLSVRKQKKIEPRTLRTLLPH